MIRHLVTWEKITDFENVLNVSLKQSTLTLGNIGLCRSKEISIGWWYYCFIRSCFQNMQKLCVSGGRRANLTNYLPLAFISQPRSQKISVEIILYPEGRPQKRKYIQSIFWERYLFLHLRLGQSTK